VKRIDRAVAAALAVTVWAGRVLVIAPGRTVVVGHVWLVLVLAIALAAALAALFRAVPRRPSAFDAAFEPAGRNRARPASLERAEREVALARGTAFDVHYRLRPSFRTLAAGLLLRRGVDLERSPERAAELVGPDVWELIRPDRPAPSDRAATGISLEAVERAVDDLEGFAWS
jgi:hypothetical protein